MQRGTLPGGQTADICAELFVELLQRDGASEQGFHLGQGLPARAVGGHGKRKLNREGGDQHISLAGRGGLLKERDGKLHLGGNKDFRFFCGSGTVRGVSGQAGCLRFVCLRVDCLCVRVGCPRSRTACKADRHCAEQQKAGQCISDVRGLHRAPPFGCKFA